MEKICNSSNIERVDFIKTASNSEVAEYFKTMGTLAEQYGGAYKARYDFDFKVYTGQIAGDKSSDDWFFDNLNFLSDFIFRSTLPTEWYTYLYVPKCDLQKPFTLFKTYKGRAKGIENIGDAKKFFTDLMGEYGIESEAVEQLENIEEAARKSDYLAVIAGVRNIRDSYDKDVETVKSKIKEEVKLCTDEQVDKFNNEFNKFKEVIGNEMKDVAKDIVDKNPTLSAISERPDVQKILSKVENINDPSELQAVALELTKDFSADFLESEEGQKVLKMIGEFLGVILEKVTDDPEIKETVQEYSDKALNMLKNGLAPAPDFSKPKTEPKAEPKSEPKVNLTNAPQTVATAKKNPSLEAILNKYKI